MSILMRVRRRPKMEWKRPGKRMTSMNKTWWSLGEICAKRNRLRIVPMMLTPALTAVYFGEKLMKISCFLPPASDSSFSTFD